MPFTVNYRGLQVECETIEDLNRLAEQQEASRAKDARKARRLARSQAGTGAEWSPVIGEQSISGLIHELKDNQKQLLSEISEAEKTDIQLRAVLHLANNKALAGVLAGISKAAKRLGLQDAPIIESKMSRSGNGDREYRYSIRPEAAEEVQKALLNGHA